jgi:hypothetical protein
MPNHVTNTMRISGDVCAVYDLLFNAEGELDFNISVPMPAILRTTTSGSRTFDIDGVPTTFRSWYSAPKPDAQSEFDTEDRPFTPAEEAELAALGAESWYDWSIANWGTKWNAYHQDPSERPEPGATEFEHTFDTAWGSPEDFFLKVADKLPEGTSINVIWLDEGGPTGSYNVDSDGVS